MVFYTETGEWRAATEHWTTVVALQPTPTQRQHDRLLRPRSGNYGVCVWQQVTGRQRRMVGKLRTETGITARVVILTAISEQPRKRKDERARN